MDLSFIFPRFIRKSSATTKEVNSIRNLKEQLTKIGYNPSEVDYMIMAHSNGCDIIKLDSEKLRAIEIALKEQLCIAKKCIAFTRGLK